MPRFSAAGTRTVGTQAANWTVASLRNTGTSDRLYVVEIGFTITGGLSSSTGVYLSRGTAAGTSTTTLAGQPHDPGEVASTGTLDTAWSSAPTFSTTNFLRYIGVPTTVGTSVIWTFYDSPIIVPASTSAPLVIGGVASQTAGNISVYMMWDE